MLWLVLYLLWVLFGFLSLFFVTLYMEDEITLGEIVLYVILSILLAGPLCALATFLNDKGDIIIYRRKSKESK